MMSRLLKVRFETSLRVVLRLWLPFYSYKPPSTAPWFLIPVVSLFFSECYVVAECNFATGADNLTTVHISVRVPASASEDVKEKVNKKGSACCAIM